MDPYFYFSTIPDGLQQWQSREHHPVQNKFFSVQEKSTFNMIVNNNADASSDIFKFNFLSPGKDQEPHHIILGGSLSTIKMTRAQVGRCRDLLRTPHPVARAHPRSSYPWRCRESVHSTVPSIFCMPTLRVCTDPPRVEI